jgi:NitT/TauT family transport system permease protein
MPPEAQDAAAALSREHFLLAREARDAIARRRAAQWRIHVSQVATLIILLVLWWAASGTLVDRLFVSDPISVARAFIAITLDGTLAYHLQRTLVEMVCGYAIGVAAGIATAIAISLIPWGEKIVRPLMMGAFAIPKVALAPLIIVWFGIFLLPKVVLAASLVVFIVYFNTLAGFASVNADALAAMRVMGASRSALFRKLILPSAAPYIFAAMRITLPGALIGAIIGEFISSNRGIGYFIAAASSRYDTARVFAGILSLLIFVLLLNLVVSHLERRAAFWRPSAGAGEMKR